MMYYKVRNWEKFQHYKNRNPPWVKLHFSLFSSYDWVILTDSERVLALSSVLLASKNDGLIPADADYVRKVANLNSRPDFSALVKCGFLEGPSDISELKEGSPNASTSSLSYLRIHKKEAVEVLEHLRLITGRSFSKYHNIAACIKREKCSVEDCKKVIEYKWREWGPDPKMAKYVDTVTLWRPGNFSDYLDQANAEKAVAKLATKMPEVY